MLTEWQWSRERYPGQKEILKYLNFCTDKLDLRRDIRLNQRVNSAVWDAAAECWQVVTDTGSRLKSRFLITAVGCLSSANMPDIEGASSFEGAMYHTGEWPHQAVNFSGKSVVVFGTGSTEIQAIRLSRNRPTI